MSTTKATGRFERIANAVGISQAGKAFLIAAVDPFHDEPIEDLRGIPDGLCSNSLVQKVKGTITIKCPPSVTSGTWDCHIQSLPILTKCAQVAGVTVYDKTQMDTTNTWVPLSGTQDRIAGSITISSAATGTANIGVFGGNNAAVMETINPAFNYTGGTYRLIAKGYEVISAGPALYKSGVVYCYGLPVSNSDITENLQIMGFDQTAVLTSTNRNAYRLPDTPLNLSEVQLIPGTQSWNASEGTYTVDRLNDPDVATFSALGVVGYCVNTAANGPDSVNSPATWGSKPSWILADFNVTNLDFSNVNSGMIKVPAVRSGADIQRFNVSGNFFTGLSLQDVLVINVIWYIERFPDDSNRDLLVLASPTPRYEPQVMDMYSSIMGEMPYAMVQGANSFGDFFRDAVDVISNTVAPVLSALPGTAGMVGKVGTIGGKLLGGLMGNSKRDEQKVNPPANYTPDGKQHIFVEKPNGQVREIKNSQTKKKKQKAAPLLKKLSRALTSKKKKKGRA